MLRMLSFSARYGRTSFVTVLLWSTKLLAITRKLSGRAANQHVLATPSASHTQLVATAAMKFDQREDQTSRFPMRGSGR